MKREKIRVPDLQISNLIAQFLILRPQITKEYLKKLLWELCGRYIEKLGSRSLSVEPIVRCHP
jgi:hypothetical protein